MEKRNGNMNRRNFFRKAALGAGALMAAPLVAKAVEEEEWTFEEGEPEMAYDESRKYPMTYDECYAPLNFPVTVESYAQFDNGALRAVLKSQHMLCLYDVVDIDPEYVNVSIPASYVVTGYFDIDWDSPDPHDSYILRPFGSATRIINPIPSGSIQWKRGTAKRGCVYYNPPLTANI